MTKTINNKVYIFRANKGDKYRSKKINIEPKSQSI